MAQQHQSVILDPPLARFLFGDTRLAWLWLPLRIWLGWGWFEAGLHKFNEPAWMDTGAALQAFWTKAVIVPEDGKAAVPYDWYRGFLQMLLESGSAPWFAKLVVYGELIVGIALIIGAFTGIAAFFGIFMNWHYVMAGAASTNAMLLVVGLVLVLAWKTAGWVGADRYLLSVVGTPWQHAPVRIPRVVSDPMEPAHQP